MSISEPNQSPRSQKRTYNYKSQPVTGYRFIDMELLSSAFQLLRCPECSNSISFHEVNKQGCAHLLLLTCCWEHEFWSSKKINSSRSKSANKNNSGFDINKRLLYSMKNCGQGFSSMEMFCYLMDIPKPSTHNNYLKQMKTVHKVV